MANYKVTDSELSGIASAIRLKGGTSDPLVFPSGFVSAISAIETKGTYISKTITSNGEYDPASDNADAFSHVTVSVPAGSSPVLVSKSISENGTYNPVDDNADAYSQVIVNVSGGGADLDNYRIFAGELSGGITDNVLTKIGNYAFYSRGSRNSPITEIETSVSEIGSYAFNGCDSLSLASIKNCKKVYDNAFTNCSMLKTVVCDNLEAISGNGFYACTNLESITAPSCSYIGTAAFASCSKLSIASFDNCTSINHDAFSRCYSLADIHFPNVVSVSYSAFISCSRLGIASFPKCKEIGYAVFAYCSNLSEVYLPLCETAGGNNFTGTNITSITLPALKIIPGQFMYNHSKIQMASFNACSKIETNAFANCSHFESIYILTPSVVSLANENAFQGTPISASSYLGYFGSIYVPASLVESYKTASRWSSFSDRITSYVEE